MIKLIRMSSFVLLVVLPISCLAMSKEEMQNTAMIGKMFTLYQAPKKDDPFTVYYPIEVKRPGRIYISVILQNIIPEPQGNIKTPLHATLVDARAFDITEESWKKWTKKAVQYAEYTPGGYVAVKVLEKVNKAVETVAGLFGKKKDPPSWYHGSKHAYVNDYRSGLTLSHSVDSNELEKTEGRYVLLFRNYSPRHRGNGKIFISYSGDYNELDKTVEKEMECHPDLVITDVSLDANKRLQASVANKQCVIHPARWKARGPEAITLMANVDGRNYGIVLPAIDPDDYLRFHEQPITYVFSKVVITKPTNVTVTVDASNKLFEANEDNNSRSVKIGGLSMSSTATPVPLKMN
jgi:hypothetical protein